MAEKNPLTPEKELLKLIEKSGSENSLHAAAIRHHGLGLFSLAALKARLAFIKNRFKDFRTKGPYQLDIKVINRLLYFLIFILAFYFVFNLSASINDLKQPLDLKFKIEKDSEAKSQPMMSLLKVASYYLEKARERDIFKMGKKKTTADILKGPSSRIIEATQNLRLVGISWSGDPDVMIEDIKNQITFFLKKGQLINNQIRVEAVFKDKVILSYKGEEIELK